MYSFVESYIFLIFWSVGRKNFIVQYLAIIKYVIKRQNASRHEIFAAAVMAGDLPRLQATVGTIQTVDRNEHCMCIKK